MRNRQLLCLSAEEGEGAALFLPHGVRQGSTGTGGREAQIDYQIHQFCSHSWICFISPAGTQEKVLVENHTQIALLLCSGLVSRRSLCKGSWKEGSAGPHFAMEPNHPRRALGAALSCFSTLGCCVLIVMASCLFSELLPAFPTSAELETPHTKLTGGLCYI